jgi:15-cis-phytoene synthase
MSLAACADLVSRADPDRFIAALAAPPEARPILIPLYAFNVEVSRAPWVTDEPMIAEMRLQWWRDALEEIGAGRPPRAHEVVTELAGILDAEAARPSTAPSPPAAGTSTRTRSRTTRTSPITSTPPPGT